MNKQELKAAITSEKKRHDDVIKDLTSKLRVFEMEDEARNRAAYKVAIQHREKQLDGTVKYVWSTSALTVTEQGLNKITHIFREGKFVPVKELMQAWEDQKLSLE